MLLPMLLRQACKVLFQEGMLKDVKTVQQAATESFVGALDHKYQRSMTCTLPSYM